MKILVAYDVSTVTTAGRRRLHRVAKICERMGQRVQKSLFECKGSKMKMEELERQLVSEIDKKQDCLRIYVLREELTYEAREYGIFQAIDFEKPMVI